MIELYLALFAFLLNFLWEMLQMPLFDFPAQTSLPEMNIACIQASAGDALVLVAAFWIVAAFKNDRKWIIHPSARVLALFLVPGLVMTIGFEALATGPLHRWSYTAAMPTVPGLGTGIVPIVQWMVVPLFVLFLARRQFR